MMTHDSFSFSEERQTLADILSQAGEAPSFSKAHLDELGWDTVSSRHFLSGTEETGPSLISKRGRMTGDFSAESPWGRHSTSLLFFDHLAAALGQLKHWVAKDLEYFRQVQEVYDEALEGLLQTRDFLGLQLDLAYENISEDEFNELASDHFEASDKPLSASARRGISLLKDASRVKLDADWLSAAFRCNISDVERLLANEDETIFIP